MNSKATIAIVAVVCLIIGAAGGYFGRPLLQPAGANSQFARGQGGFRNGNGRFFIQNGPMGGRVIGTVQSMSDGRLTVTLPDGSSKIVLTNDSTTYQHVTTGSASDVTNGTQVLVTGQPNQDGSTTANTIEVVPAGMNLPFGNRQGGNNNNGQPVTSAPPQ